MNNAVFVISEFNPFHFGHKYLIDTLHRTFGTVVCVMSGNAVQRGEVAIAEKYLRARIAVENGVDLVVELPFPFCTLSAKDFALSGVSLAASLGAESLGFGCEDDGEMLIKAASFLTRQKITEYISLHPNLSYPKASKAILEENMPEYSELMTKPNNILGVEYLRAISEVSPYITPFFVRRASEYASSSTLRKAILSGSGAILPEKTSLLLENSAIWETKKLDTTLIASMRLAAGKNPVYGIDEGSFLRIRDAAMRSTTLEELYANASSPNLTNARIRRTTLFTLFGIGKEYQKKRPSYALVLAANEKGRAYLGENRHYFSIPVLTKPADYLKLSENAKLDFAVSFAADSVLSLASGREYNPLRMTPYMK